MKTMFEFAYLVLFILICAVFALTYYICIIERGVKKSYSTMTNGISTYVPGCFSLHMCSIFVHARQP